MAGFFLCDEQNMPWCWVLWILTDNCRVYSLLRLTKPFQRQYNDNEGWNVAPLRFLFGLKLLCESDFHLLKQIQQTLVQSVGEKNEAHKRCFYIAGNAGCRPRDWGSDRRRSSKISFICRRFQTRQMSHESQVDWAGDLDLGDKKPAIALQK